MDLGEVTLKSGKIVRAWAVEGDLDPELSHSNETEIEWPPRSGRRILVPEIDDFGRGSLHSVGQLVRLDPRQKL